MDFDLSEQIEGLLSVWYRWSMRQSHAEQLSHYYRSTDSVCRGYQTPQTEAEEDEATDRWLENRTGEQVQLCIDRLTFDQRAAISNSLRNKEVGFSVWRNRGAATTAEWHYVYQSAKDALLPLLIARHLVKAAVPA
jgi:hypothetical protein